MSPSNFRDVTTALNMNPWIPWAGLTQGIQESSKPKFKGSLVRYTCLRKGVHLIFKRFRRLDGMYIYCIYVIYLIRAGKKQLKKIWLDMSLGIEITISINTNERKSTKTVPYFEKIILKKCVILFIQFPLYFLFS